VVVTAGDRSVDPYGLASAHWDLLARLPGLQRLDLVATDTVLAGPLHERVHQVLPGVEEIRFEPPEPPSPPVLVVAAAGGPLHVLRDREEEVASFARRVKHTVRSGGLRSLDRAALVVRQPLPYVYVAREVLRSAGIPCQLFDALPLAAEPCAAALDLVCSFVSAAFARTPGVALLRSPHFDLATGCRADDVPALDRALSEEGYLGELTALERLIGAWNGGAARGRPAGAVRAGAVLLQAARELAPLRMPAPPAEHFSTLLAFLLRHERVQTLEPALADRHRRARAAVIATLESLRRAYDRFDASPAGFDDVAALVRQRIDAQTFAPRSGDSGVHVVDAASAVFGGFDLVQIAGLVEDEWPGRAGRNIFYSHAVLRELGWPSESDRMLGARAAFGDLLRLPSQWLAASTFTLEADTLVSPSPFVEAIEHAGLPRVQETLPRVRIFEHEALARDPIDEQPLGAIARRWLEVRRRPRAADSVRYRGFTAPHRPASYSLSALERYQDCPFKFFSEDVLRLEEAPEDESALSPRARGRFIHEVFQRFFEAWDARGEGTITPDRLDSARSLLAEVAEPLLLQLREPDAALERSRLFGSAISVGIADIVLGVEAARAVPVRERWLERRFEGDFTLGAPDGRCIRLRGVADRIDLLSGNRLRVIDYKSGYPPNPRRALQVPVYALCAQEQLSGHGDASWEVDEAAYIAFSGRRSFVPVVKAGANAGEVLAAARARLHAAVDAIERGEFPPRPHDPMLCRYCAYSAVCRKDYVDLD
jgi:RecB family exonuclease